VARLSEAARDATAHLRRVDTVMRRVIDRVGPFRPSHHRNRYWSLVRAIVSQQISGAAARSILTKVRAEVGEEAAPEDVLALGARRLRRCGVSPQKQSYLIDLSTRCVSGDVKLARIGRLNDEQVIAELTRVRGIGCWTAQMFLIFTLRRLDVFPFDDLGVRQAIRNLYDFGEMPNRRQCDDVSMVWQPYRSVASWYCWRSHDIESWD